MNKLKDNFEGTIFKTKKGSTLTVLPWDGTKKSGKKYYPLHCSVCSKDEELFPNFFYASKSDLNKGVIPCGCGSYKWNAEQYKVRFKRTHPNNIILNWGESGFNYIKSRPTTFCTTHKVTSTGKELNHLLNGEIFACNECANVSRIEKVCRPKQEMTQLLINYLKGIGGKFIEFAEDYKGVGTKVKWECNEGHHPVTVAYSLLVSNNGCSKCKRNGYRSDVPGYFYITAFEGWCPEQDDLYSHIKFGITNKHPNIRNKQQKVKTIYDKIFPICCFYFKKGSDARLLESELKALYNNPAVSKERFPDGYTETISTDLLDQYDLYSDIFGMTGYSLINSEYDKCGVGYLPFKDDYWLV